MVPGLSDNHQVPVLTETKRRNGRFKEWYSQGRKKGKNLVTRKYLGDTSEREACCLAGPESFRRGALSV